MAAGQDDKAWLDTIKKSFVDVTVSADKGINTSEFLDAAESLTTLLDVLGSTAFSPVKSDMTTNISKVRERQLQSPGESETLQALVKGELATKKHKATEGLLWLVRALEFLAEALRADISNNTGVSLLEVKPKQELATSFKEAYGKTLKQYHSFLIKPIFAAAMSAAPYRKDFIAKVFGPNPPPTAQDEMNNYVSALEERVAILKTFLNSPEGKW